MESRTQKISEDFLVNTQTGGTQQNPAVGRLASGGFVVAWQTDDATQDGSTAAIKARLFAADGTTVGNEFLVNTQSAQQQMLPEVAGLANGGFLIAWQTSDPVQDGSGYAIKARLYHANGQPAGNEFRVNDNAFADQFSATVAALPDGGFILAWNTASVSPTELQGGIKARIYGADGVPRGGEFLVSTSPQTAASIGVLADGRLLIAWTGIDVTSGGIKARMFDPSGQPLGNEFFVNDEMDDGQYAPAVAVLAEGGFAVTWYTMDTRQDGNGYAIKARLFDGDGKPLGEEFLVNTVPGFDQYSPAIASLPDGGFAIGWYSGDSTVTARVFRADGSPEGDQFMLNAQGSGGVELSLVGMPDGTLVATWTGLGENGSDGSGTAIRAAIFDPSLAPSAHSDTLLTKTGVAISLPSASLLANDSDLDEDSLTITSVANASHGSVSRNGTTINFMPAAEFTGKAGFDYTVSDGKGGTDTAHVSVFVLPETFPSEWRLFAPDGFKGEVAGNGGVAGTAGYQAISILDLPGVTVFDPSFNRGGDVITLAGESGSWSIVQNGSSAMLFRDETVVVIPLGVTPSKLVFDDGWLSLRIDAAAAAPKIGTQAFSTAATPVTAATNTLELPDGSDPATAGRLYLAGGGEVTLQGDYTVFGTAGAEHVDFIGGKLQLDPSFNRGGDTLATSEFAFEFSAVRVGSSVQLTGTDGSEVLIPVGKASMTIDFNGDERELYVDTTLGAILLGSQMIGASPVALIA